MVFQLHAGNLVPLLEYICLSLSPKLLPIQSVTTTTKKIFHCFLFDDFFLLCIFIVMVICGILCTIGAIISQLYIKTNDYLPLSSKVFEVGRMNDDNVARCYD
jgi:hypothetical protein